MRIYRGYWKFDSGYAAFAIPRPYPDKEGRYKNQVAVLDLNTYLTYFGEPAKLVTKLTKATGDLSDRWQQINSGRPHKRAIEWSEEIGRCSWMNFGKLETSVWEITLNTYGFSLRGQEGKMTANDVKVTFELRAVFSICHLILCRRC